MTIDPKTEAATLILLLCFLQDSPAAAYDSVGRVLQETDRDAALNVIVCALSLLVAEIDYGHHRDTWVQYIQDRLVGAVGPVPDTLAELEGDR
jgi:hypothetical protein